MATTRVEAEIATRPKSDLHMESWGSGPPVVLWNHRWEHDKGPERLLALVQTLAESAPQLPLHWSIVGPQFRRRPPAFADIESGIRGQPQWQLLHFGCCDEGEYRHVLRSADVALSTSLHDFQGLAVLEAVAAGCTPCVPDRLAYREFVDAQCRYDSADDVGAEASRAAALIVRWAGLRHRGQSLPQCTVDALMWSRLSRPMSSCCPACLQRLDEGAVPAVVVCIIAATFGELLRF